MGALTLGAVLTCAASILQARLEAASYQGDAPMRLEGLSCHMWSRKNAKERADAACPRLDSIAMSCIQFPLSRAEGIQGNSYKQLIQLLFMVP